MIKPVTDPAELAEVERKGKVVANGAVRPFDDKYWLIVLNRMLAGVEGFGPARWLNARQRYLCLPTKDQHGKAAVSRLVGTRIFEHLRRWAAREPLTLFVAPGMGEGAPAPELEVKDGEVWLCSGFEKPRTVSGESFREWFERQFTLPFPLPWLAPGMREVAANIWASEGVQAEQIEGFPHYLEAKGGAAHRVVAFAGYGVNSWACYYTDVRPGVRVRLRIGYGGVYCNPTIDANRLVDEIAAVDALVHELREPPGGARGLDHIDIFDCMGQFVVTLRLGEAARSLDMLWPSSDCWQQLRDAARELSAGQSTRSPTSSA